jgi:uncharacterized protein (TIGR02246 family)
MKMPATDPSDLHRRFLVAVNEHDLEALLDLYETDAVAADLDGNTLLGHAALRPFLEGFLSVVETIEGGTRKALVSGDLALMSSTWTASLVVGGVPLERTGTTAEIARRQPDGSWRFVADDPVFID